MALGDYILCCKCECKLIYDGDRGQREWWVERWGVEPQIECPDCKKEAGEARPTAWLTAGPHTVPLEIHQPQPYGKAVMKAAMELKRDLEDTLKKEKS